CTPSSCSARSPAPAAWGRHRRRAGPRRSARCPCGGHQRRSDVSGGVAASGTILGEADVCSRPSAGVSAMIARPDTPPPGATKDAVVRTLAARQHEVEPDIELVFRLEAPGREEDPAEPIKLLIVNPNTVATGIMPIWFPRDSATG